MDNVSFAIEFGADVNRRDTSLQGRPVNDL